MIGQLYQMDGRSELYVVVGLCVLEANGRPAVLYRYANCGIDIVFAMEKGEFLDGAFVPFGLPMGQVPKRHKTSFRCFFGRHDLETISNEAGCFGKCKRCGAEVGFVSHSDLQRDLPPRSSSPTAPPPPKPNR